MTEQSACFAPKQPVDEEKAKLKSRAKESNVWELVSREKCPLLLCSERHDWQTPSWLFETGCVQLWARLQSTNWCCAVTVITWAFGRFYTVLGELLCIISGYRCHGSFHLMKPADNGEWELTSFNKNPSLVRERAAISTLTSRVSPSSTALGLNTFYKTKGSTQLVYTFGFPQRKSSHSLTPLTVVDPLEKLSH